MYGDLANKLIIEAKRTQQLTQRRNVNISSNNNSDSGSGSHTSINNNQNSSMNIPMYNDELVRNILKEVNQLSSNREYFRDTATNDKVSKCQYFVNSLCLERNKRCLMAYHKMRSDMIDSIVWQNNGSMGGGGGDIANLTNESTANTNDNNDLSHVEQAYLKGYSDLLSDMKSGILADIDITGSLTPPSDIFIDVRVLRDAGEIQTEYGTFNLVKDSQFFVRQSDVERLIQQGYLQKI